METHVGRVVIVTGACGGIGGAISSRFADAGASLALCDVRGSALERLASGFTSGGGSVYSAAIDVTDAEQAHEFCARAAETLGGVDCLINTVGVVDNMGDVQELPLPLWEKTLAVNLTSAFIMAKYAVPQMKQRGSGSIINISSVSGMANQPAAMAYSVTKAGLISLTKSEAIDLARYNIRANAICPGSVETPLLEDAIRLMAREEGLTPEDKRQAWISDYPTRRFTQPGEVAELALFLCSERAKNITGASIVIDGGLTALLPER